MLWEGYNYEDVILILERFVKEDVYIFIYIEEYECEVRDIKFGFEEIIRDILNVGEDVIKDLDERGIIRIGVEVKSGDIFVGKVILKGEIEFIVEERFLRVIFGEKVREIRDMFLRVLYGEGGIVVDVKVFFCDKGDEFLLGVNQFVRVYVVQKRKILVGDKMVGCYGNKGVILRILFVEDMLFLFDGIFVDIVLNLFGVLLCMNIGQILEIYFGYAVKVFGWKVVIFVFDGVKEEDIEEVLKFVGLNFIGKIILYDGRIGELFDNEVIVGYMYMLKFVYFVDDKIYVCFIGLYLLVIQQFFGGKVQFGGQ